MSPGTAIPHGFTLVEFMVTLAIGAILIAAAMPNMADFLRRHRAMASANSLQSAMHQARASALSLGRFVTVAPMNGDWSRGWQVFAEQGSPNGQLDGADRLIAQYDSLPTDVVVTTRTIPAGAFLAFSPAGYPQTTARAPMTMKLGVRIGTARRVVEISQMGSTRVCDPDAQGGGICVMP